MNVLVFGLGLVGGGLAAAKYYLQKGDFVRVTDLKEEKAFPASQINEIRRRGGELIFGTHRLEDFQWADLVVRNAAIRDDNPYLEHCRSITTDLVCLLSSPLVKSIGIIAVTGSKGKTTTATSISHLLTRNDMETLICGNMGISGYTVLTELEKRAKHHDKMPRFICIEFSSWNIRDAFNPPLKDYPVFSATVITNLLEDHLNYYKDFESYAREKLLIAQAPTRVIICPDELKTRILDIYPKLKTEFLSLEGLYQKLDTDNLKVEPRFFTSFAVCKSLGLTKAKMLSAHKTFSEQEHRSEFVGYADNVLFINDSSATIPSAVLYTISSMKGYAITLICGGTDKNLSPATFIEVINKVGPIILLDGTFTREKLIPLLLEKQRAYEGPFETMGLALKCAFAKSKELADSKLSMFQYIVLSPGAASFELFENELDRGRQFKNEAVKIIKKHGGEHVGLLNLGELEAFLKKLFSSVKS